MQQPVSASHDAATPLPGRSDAPDMVKVWDWPLRACHWSLAFFVALAWFTPGTHDGLHRFAGYAVIVLIAFRIGWGLNPAGTAMLAAMLLLLSVSTVTGWMSTTVRFFGVPWVEDTHGYVSDAVIVLAAVHVLGVLLMCVLQKENLIRAMVTGWKRRAAVPARRV